MQLKEGLLSVHLLALGARGRCDISPAMADWSEGVDPESGKTYWFNEQSGQASWSDPNWQQAFDDESGNWYWFHGLTQASSWETPAGVDEDELAALGLAPGVAQAGRSGSVYEAPSDDLLSRAKEELRSKYAKQYLTHKFLRSAVPLLADMTPDEATALAKHFKLKTLTPESKMFEEVRAVAYRPLLCGGHACPWRRFAVDHTATRSPRHPSPHCATPSRLQGNYEQCMFILCAGVTALFKVDPGADEEICVQHCEVRWRRGTPRLLSASTARHCMSRAHVGPSSPKPRSLGQLTV